jgi:hypothetical protein
VWTRINVSDKSTYHTYRLVHYPTNRRTNGAKDLQYLYLFLKDRKILSHAPKILGFPTTSLFPFSGVGGLSTINYQTMMNSLFSSSIRRGFVVASARGRPRPINPTPSLVSHSGLLFSSSSDTVTVSIEEAQSTTAKALEQIGWDSEDAALQAEIMTSAELCGNNQGLVKMFDPTMMQPSPDSGKPFVERVTGNSAVLNANQAPGMLAAVMGADKAVELCQTNTVSIVCTHNTSTSSGQLAFYAERMCVF